MIEFENVVPLPVRFKDAGPEERVFEIVHTTKCWHRAQFIVDESLATVECGACHEKLNPMWVLNTLAKEDRRMHEAHDRYKDEMRRLTERSSTKCQHCQKMTRISRS